MQWLLELGCNVNIRDQRGATPISTAIRHRNMNAKDLLIKFGADQPSENANLGGGLKSKNNTKNRVPVNNREKSKVNDRLIPKEYVLQVFDGE